jgi:fluoride exporter
MYSVIAICIGASLGAISRWQLSVWLNQAGSTGVAVGTLSANWIGAYLVGLGFVWLQTHTALDPMWRLLIMTGFLGALTTFSTFSLETVNLLHGGHFASALANAGLNLLGSLALTYAGMRTAQWLWQNTAQ